MIIIIVTAVETSNLTVIICWETAVLTAVSFKLGLLKCDLRGGTCFPNLQARSDAHSADTGIRFLSNVGRLTTYLPNARRHIP
jgi:hypothetical protein